MEFIRPFYIPVYIVVTMTTATRSSSIELHFNRSERLHNASSWVYVLFLYSNIKNFHKLRSREIVTIETPHKLGHKTVV